MVLRMAHGKALVFVSVLPAMRSFVRHRPFQIVLLDLTQRVANSARAWGRDQAIAN